MERREREEEKGGEVGRVEGLAAYVAVGMEQV